MNIMNENIKTFLNVLHEYGYLYLARDPDDHSLYAYKSKPHLEDGCYVLSDNEMEQGFSCFLITPGSVETFIKIRQGYSRLFRRERNCRSSFLACNFNEYMV